MFILFILNISLFRLEGKGKIEKKKEQFFFSYRYVSPISCLDQRWQGRSVDLLVDFSGVLTTTGAVALTTTVTTTATTGVTSETASSVAVSVVSVVVREGGVELQELLGLQLLGLDGLGLGGWGVVWDVALCLGLQSLLDLSGLWDLVQVVVVDLVHVVGKGHLLWAGWLGLWGLGVLGQLGLGVALGLLLDSQLAVVVTPGLVDLLLGVGLAGSGVTVGHLSVVVSSGSGRGANVAGPVVVTASLLVPDSTLVTTQLALVLSSLGWVGTWWWNIRLLGGSALLHNFLGGQRNSGLWVLNVVT